MPGWTNPQTVTVAAWMPSGASSSARERARLRRAALPRAAEASPGLGARASPPPVNSRVPRPARR